MPFYHIIYIVINNIQVSRWRALNNALLSIGSFVCVVGFISSALCYVDFIFFSPGHLKTDVKMSLIHTWKKIGRYIVMSGIWRMEIIWSQHFSITIVIGFMISIWALSYVHQIRFFIWIHCWIVWNIYITFEIWLNDIVDHHRNK